MSLKDIATWTRNFAMNLANPLRNAVATAALVAACSPALAGVIFQQAPAAAVSNAWTSHVGVGVGGFKAFENFEVDRNASVGVVSWRGTYFDTSGGGLAGGVPNTTAWNIEFWNGDASGPNSMLYQATVSPDAVDRRAVGTGDFGAGPFTVYDLVVDLATDFDVLAGEDYWISIVSIAGSFNPFFSWTNAEGDGSTYQQLLSSAGVVASTFVRGGDRAFALSDHTVPEPTSVALAAVGLLAAGLARRRR